MNANYANTAHAAATSHTIHLGGRQLGNDEYGTLIIDRRGRICGSGAAADNLFGAARGRITGREISVFIPDLHPDGGSPGDQAGSLASLCERNDWQSFEAMDVIGRGFVVEILVSRRMTNGEEVFVLNFYRPGEPLFSRIC